MSRRKMQNSSVKVFHTKKMVEFFWQKVNENPKGRTIERKGVSSRKHAGYFAQKDLAF